MGMIISKMGLSQLPKKAARSPGPGEFFALSAPSQALRTPTCAKGSRLRPSEFQIEAGDQTTNFGSQDTFGSRPSRNVMLPPRLPPMTALKLFLFRYPC